MLKELKNGKCLHCGKGIPLYCEDCFQDLIAKNMELQLRVAELERKIEQNYTPKHLKEDCNDVGFDNDIWKHIPTIDC